MTIALTDPLDDIVISQQEKRFLQDLQANILKGHGREHVALIFIAAKEGEVAKARQFLRGFPVTNAFQQLDDTVQFKTTRAPGGVVRLAFLSQAGLTVFGHGPKFMPFGLFNGGMAKDTAVLDAGSTASWQAELKKPVHALLLVAYHDETALANIVGKLVSDLEDEASGLEVVFVQEGRAYKNLDGQGIEHFGYVDGRSQPLMLKSELQKELRTVYDPKSPLGQFLISDPLNTNAHGSFFVFRKLEQNVAGFKQAETDLAINKLKLVGADDERAGAQVVGRFEDGTPLTVLGAANGGPVVNDFDYSADTGGKCPVQAHIRKSNPRGTSGKGLTFDKSVQMARRGITYGQRLQDPVSKEFIDKPNDGVGLLFMSYQASIEKQFHFMQTHWVNNEDFPKVGVGIDPVIGQGASTLPQTWPPTYGSTVGSVPSLFKGFVTLKGGEYFYAPSLSGLKAL
jgi:Dyp-type peroxidase family